MEIKRSQPRKVKFKMPYPDYEKEKDIVEYDIIDVVEKTGEGDTDFIVVKKQVEVSRMNRQKYYDEQAKGHTLYQMIEKVLLTGDYAALHSGQDGIYGDFSKLPLDRGEAAANHDALMAALANLDPELVGDDLFKFLKDVTPEDIEKFYKDKLEQKPAAAEGGNE